MKKYKKIKKKKKSKKERLLNHIHIMKQLIVFCENKELREQLIRRK